MCLGPCMTSPLATLFIFVLEMSNPTRRSIDRDDVEAGVWGDEKRRFCTFFMFAVIEPISVRRDSISSDAFNGCTSFVRHVDGGWGDQYL